MPVEAEIRPRNMLDSLRRRLILMVLLALAPIAALNFIQGVMQLNIAQDDARRRLLQFASASAASQESVFASAENVLQALKNVADVRDAGPSCQAILHGAVLTLPFMSNISVADSHGRIVCAALPPGTINISGESWWQRGARERNFILAGEVFNRAGEREALIGVMPLRQNGGSFAGGLIVDIDVPWLESLLQRMMPPAHGIVAIFSATGAELLSNNETASAALFGGETVLRDVGELREVKDARGRSFTYATAPLGRDGMVTALAMPTDRLFRWTLLTVAASFALPALIVVLSLAGLWLAVNRIVLRWVLYLRRVAAVYAHGHYSFRPTRLDAAPSEFRALGVAVENMACAVRERDARLRQGLAEKTVLVREIHHRIKNSLQMVVSLISLYGSGITGADRRRFDQLRTRVNTLALVHRILYEAEEGSQVHLRELLGELSGLLETASEQPVRITVEAEDAELPTDMAVPLALMVVEIVLGIAADGPPEGSSILPLTLRGRVADARLAIAVSAPLPRSSAPREASAETLAPGNLAHGFAAQLDGHLSSVEADGRRTTIGDFPCRGC